MAWNKLAYQKYFSLLVGTDERSQFVQEYPKESVIRWSEMLGMVENFLISIMMQTI